MRVGLVCPYDWEVPGGAREHISGLAEASGSRSSPASTRRTWPNHRRPGRPR